MKRILFTVLMLTSIASFAQPQFGGQVGGYNNAGVKKFWMFNGNEGKVWDSTANVYNLAQKLKLDSLYTKINSSIAVTGTFWQATQPVSLASVPSHAVTNAGTFAVQSTQSGTWNITNVSGTVSLPTGASTSALQGTANTLLQGIKTIDSNIYINTDATNIYLQSIETLSGNIQTSVDNISTWVDNNTLPSITDSTLAPVNGVNIYGMVRNSSPTLIDGKSGLLSLTKYGATRVTLYDTLGAYVPISAGGGGSSSFTSYDSVGSNTSMTVTNLNSLASSATVGWQSDTVINRTRQATDYRIFVKATMANTAPASDKQMYVYIAPFYYDGSTYLGPSLGTTSQATGVQGSCTIASGAPNNLILLGVLSYSTQNMVLQSTFSLSSIFGKTLPDAWSLILINTTGSAVSASGNNVYFKPVYVTNR